MAFVGGFLGGGVEMVPAGQGQLCLQWLTPDRRNIEGAIFKGQGPDGQSFTVEGGADGRMDKLVPVGRWTISVDHDGVYDNDGPQIVDVESTQSYLVIFGASTVQGSILIQNEMLGATMTITRDADSEVVYTGEVHPSEINTGLGSFTVKIDQFGQTITISLTVAGKTKLDLTSYVVNLTIPEDYLQYGDVDFDISGFKCTGSFQCLKSVGALKISTVSSLKWDDVTPVKSEQSISVAESDLTVSKPEYSQAYVISENATKTLPKLGEYWVTMCGGGGGGGGGGGTDSSSSNACEGGGSGGGGGKGGAVNSVKLTATSLEYTVSIGAGGDGGSAGSKKYAGYTGSAGKSTTISGAFSASASGGNGGSGGTKGSSSSSYTYGGTGGPGGDGSNSKSMPIHGSNISYGAGGSGGSAGYDTSADSGITKQPGSGSAGNTPSVSLSQFTGSGKGGTGGSGGYATMSVSNGSIIRAEGGTGGYGGTGLKVNGTSYGVGGRGGTGGRVYYVVNTSDYSEAHQVGSKGSTGTSGVAVLELVL